MNRKFLSGASAVLLAAVVFTGCGNGSNTGSGTDSSSTGGGTVTSTPAASTPAASVSPSDSEGGAQAAGGTEEITVTAKNFEFDKKEIHVKKGDKVKLTLKSAQGAHGLEIPDYNVNLKGEGTIEFVADKAGTFDFNCSVMCGTGHDNMTGKLIVE